jgi:hypothetical protein
MDGMGQQIESPADYGDTVGYTQELLAAFVGCNVAVTHCKFAQRRYCVKKLDGFIESFVAYNLGF